MMNCPTNKPRGFHIGTTWKQSFPRRFNVESMWCISRAEVSIKKGVLKNYVNFTGKQLC